MSSSNSSPDQSSSHPAPSEETSAELYAASAAERTILSSKDHDKDHNSTRPGDAVQDTSFVDLPQASSTVRKDAEKSTDVDVIARETPTTKEEERTLTKEELIEEALNCPCIASMKEGSCGQPFLAAYRCFLESETEPKGMDCMDQFKTMQTCIGDHPEEYNFDDENDPEDDPFANAPSTTPTSSAPKDSSQNPASQVSQTHAEHSNTPASASPSPTV